jgi:hypothetical protein
VARLMRLVKLAFGALLAAIAVWIEAVLRTPEIKRRKALRRRSRVLPKS